MTDHRLAIPLQLALPGGVVAAHVAGSDPPRYTVDGVLVDVDVTIPPDLAAWEWRGSFLCWRGDDPVGQLVISTDLHPPPGWPCDRRDCFTVARGFDLSPIAPVAPVAAAAPKRAKRTRTAQVVQLSLFEEVAA